MSDLAITLITCTGDRPAAFALQERWMQQQTIPYAQWLVLCDGQSPTRCTLGQEFYYWPELRGFGSMPAKLERVVQKKLVRGAVFFIIEDDDYYAPDYLEAMVGALFFHALVGEGRAVYYHVAWRCWHVNGNMELASLCQTGMRRSMLSAFEGLLKIRPANVFVDDILWKQHWTTAIVFDPDESGRRCIGIKGMPGRRGYGTGHIQRQGTFPDPKLDHLRAFIGADAQAYAPFYNPQWKP